MLHFLYAIISGIEARHFGFTLKVIARVPHRMLHGGRILPTYTMHRPTHTARFSGYWESAQFLPQVFVKSQNHKWLLVLPSDDDTAWLDLYGSEWKCLWSKYTYNLMDCASIPLPERLSLLLSCKDSGSFGVCHAR